MKQLIVKMEVTFDSKYKLHSYNARFLQKITDSPRYVSLFNVYNWTLGEKESELSQIYQSSILLCDSYWISKFIRWRNKKFIGIRGADLLRSAFSKSFDGVHLFVGGNELSFEKISYSIEDEKLEGIKVCHLPLPPNVDLVEAVKVTVEFLEKTVVDIVWVVLGTPKQDFVGNEIYKISGKPVIGIGAAFDYVSTKSLEAPLIIRKIGMEWLFRFLIEPKRLFQRYADSLKFVFSRTIVKIKRGLHERF